MRNIKAKTKFIVGGVITAIVLIAGLIITSMFITKVSVGTVGVVYNIDGVKDETLSQGWHVLKPLDKVIEYPVKTQTIQFDSIAVATKDGKNIDIDMAFNFNVDPTKAVSLYNKFGAVEVKEIANTYLKTRLRDASRKVVSKYSVIDIYGEKSSQAQAEIQEVFSQDVEELGFIVEGLMLGIPKADKETQKAIDERVKASQNLEKKNIEIETAKKEAERLQIEAKGIAEYNETISKSLTKELIQKQALEKWDGKLPQVSGDNGTLIDIPLNNK